MNTERRNPRSVDLDLFPTEHILRIINAEDAAVAAAVRAAIPQISKAVDLSVATIRAGGRMFYVGAGASGRLAILDAAECPPTFGSPPEWMQAVIAGGARALACAMEEAEDNCAKAAADLKSRKISARDLVIGIAASGKTPYTLAALEYANSKNARTIAIVCDTDSPMSRSAHVVVCIETGPEIITGSTRMKAGTAQKMALNMISTVTMIRLGMTYSNWMINVSMTNSKLKQRGIQILREILAVPPVEAERLAEACGGKLKLAVIMGAHGCSRKEAEKRLAEGNGDLRKAVGHLSRGRE